MNLIDYAILAILLFFILRGFYDGFLVTVLSSAAFFLSWLSSVVLSPFVAKTFISNANLTQFLLNYAEGSEMIGNIESAKLSVSQLSPVTLKNIISNSTLPLHLRPLVEKNIIGEVFAKNSLETVGEYFNQTIFHFAINVFSFLIIFILVRALLATVIRCSNAISPFPVLLRFDRTFGSVFGFLRGIFFVFLVFMLIPVLFLVFNSLPITTDFEQSFLEKFFYHSNFLLTLIKGV